MGDEGGKDGYVFGNRITPAALLSGFPPRNSGLLLARLTCLPKCLQIKGNVCRESSGTQEPAVGSGHCERQVLPDTRGEAARAGEHLGCGKTTTNKTRTSCSHERQDPSAQPGNEPTAHNQFKCSKGRLHFLRLIQF